MRKILIIEDDRTQNDVLANFLRHEGYEVFSAYTLADAGKLLAIDRKESLKSLHLVILDLMLPDGNGLEFLQEPRQKSNVPVIVLTALDDEFTQLQTFECKADEYIDKPVSPLVMTKRVNALMARFYGEKKETSVKIGAYYFDFDSFQVHREDGTSVNLTTMEMKIIRLLYNRRGAVVSRDSIMDDVWGSEYVGADRLIDTHIKNIRKKTDADIIVTVKGVGYRMA